MPGSDLPDGRQRLDKWLWCARFVRSREAAVSLVASGHVRINGHKTVKPGHAVKPGDVLTVVMARQVLVVQVRGLAERRGSAASARLLYVESSAQKSGASQARTC